MKQFPAHDDHQRPYATLVLAAEQPPGATSASLLERLANYRLTVLAGALVGLILGLAAPFLVPEKHSASATVVVGSVSGEPLAAGRLGDQINIASEASVALSEPVVAAAAAKMTPPLTPAELRDIVDVVAPSQSLVLKFTARTEDADTAIQAANLVAQAYLYDRATTAAENTKRYVDSLDGTIKSIVSRRTKAVDLGQREAFDRTISELRTQQGLARLQSLNPGRVASFAGAPAALTSPPWWTLVLGLVVLGTLAGVALAGLHERFDRRVRFPARMAEITKATVISGAEPLNNAQVRDVIGLVAAGAEPVGGGHRAEVALLSLWPAGVGGLIEQMQQVADADGLTLEVKRATIADLPRGVWGDPGAGSRSGDAGSETAATSDGPLTIAVLDASGFDLAGQGAAAARTPASLLLARWDTPRAAAVALADDLARRGVVLDAVIFVAAEEHGGLSHARDARVSAPMPAADGT